MIKKREGVKSFWGELLLKDLMFGIFSAMLDRFGLEVFDCRPIIASFDLCGCLASF